MKNLSFIEYIATLDILESCIILAEHLWNPEFEDTPFWDFCYNLFTVIYEDYRKEYDETESLVQAIEDTVYVGKIIEKKAVERGRKYLAEREADSPIFM